MRPRISIVTPSFNQRDYIEETIDSIISQKYPNFEHIIIDGGSTDGSVDVIKKYQKYLTFWTSEKDQGQSHAINKGLTHCTGTIFNWINSDDYLEPDAFEKIEHAFHHPKIQMATFSSRVVGLEDRILDGTKIHPGNLPKAIGIAHIQQPGTFFRMEAVREMGLLDNTLNYCMDVDWLIRFFLLFGNECVVKSSDIIANFRLHEASKSTMDQIKFEVEQDLIYSELASSWGQMESARLIRELSDLPEPSLGTRNPKINTDLLNSEKLEQVLTHYLRKRYIEFYEKLNAKKCNRIYSAIDRSRLSGDDVRSLEVFNWRMRTLGASVLNILRKISRIREAQA